MKNLVHILVDAFREVELLNVRLKRIKIMQMMQVVQLH